MSKQTTLCYIEKEGAYLMLHRIKKEQDENRDKWIGVGGKFEDRESPEDCVLREVKEETGLTLTDYKWIGVGGKFEDRESPEDCVLREVKEETGLTLTDYKYRGIVTFVSDVWPCEYMHLFTATGFEGEIRECDEGVLEWLPKEQLYGLPMWAGDRIFLELLDKGAPFFSLKLVYEGEVLRQAVLDGKKLDV